MQAGSLGGSDVLKEARWRGSLTICWCSWSNSGEEVGFLGAFHGSASSLGQRLSWRREQGTKSGGCFELLARKHHAEKKPRVSIMTQARDK